DERGNERGRRGTRSGSTPPTALIRIGLLFAAAILTRMSDRRMVLPAAPRPMSKAPDRGPVTILAVDDDEPCRQLARHTLEDEHYRVVLAANGAQGIAAFDRERPACVLLDVRMADMSGFEVCAKIRSLPEGTDTPVIFLTALRDLET